MTSPKLSLPDPPFSPPPEPEENSLAEFIEYSKNRLDAAARKGEHDRTEILKTAAARTIAGVIYTIGFVSVWSIAALSFHTLFSSNWHYLDAGQLSDIKILLGVIFASGLLSDYAKRLMEK